SVCGASFVLHFTFPSVEFIIINAGIRNVHGDSFVRCGSRGRRRCSTGGRCPDGCPTAAQPANSANLFSAAAATAISQQQQSSSHLCTSNLSWAYGHPALLPMDPQTEIAGFNKRPTTTIWTRKCWLRCTGSGGGGAAHLPSLEAAVLRASSGQHPLHPHHPQHHSSPYHHRGASQRPARKNATRETNQHPEGPGHSTEHKKNPYPTKGEKIMLAIITTMTLTQTRGRPEDDDEGKRLSTAAAAAAAAAAAFARGIDEDGTKTLTMKTVFAIDVNRGRGALGDDQDGYVEDNSSSPTGLPVHPSQLDEKSAQATNRRDIDKVDADKQGRDRRRATKRRGWSSSGEVAKPSDLES
uniref:Uncharacterized protein n=1 Tax=Macrostomum lignano TaxID=282301 RepID=A0A1I8FDW4_9PLAT